MAPMRAIILVAATLGLSNLALALPVAAGPLLTVTVPSDGTVVTVDLDAAGTYAIVASGTYQYALGGVSPADADHSFGPDGLCYDRPGNVLDLLVDGQSPWRTPCNAAHAYPVTYSCLVAPCAVRFQIHDDHYPDNSGSLRVSIVQATP